MSELQPSPLMAGDRHLSVAEARAAIAAALRPIEGRESLPLAETLGRVLADDLISPIDVPAHDNSAMDGYAFAGAALHADHACRLTVVGTVLAGKPFDGTVAAGECVRIMTGAVMPAGADSVVPLELCHIDGATVQVEPGVIEPGENRRRRGEDLARGQAALRAGRVLKPADLGLAASLGLRELVVMRRLRVALFSTGDELRAPGEPLAPGCIYDSNRSALQAALQRLGVEVVDLGLVRDDRAALQATLEAAVAQADVVLTSGGVSVGDADHTRELLGQMGEVAFWKVAMRPGRPFAFGPLHARSAGSSSWLFALPGNPVAALVSFYAFVREALLLLAGANPEPLPVLQARCTAAIRKRPGRTEFQRGIVEPGADGAWQVRITGAQGAGILRSMSEANALVVLRHEQASVAAGDPVDVWLFDGLT
ncbi:MAG: molybdopterin molybdenumtransferase MoeA [Rubrivivax sp. SCN 70-15]|nr:MAG: molybdopterin molybdenumtransferase MoeA [Rubrivivax sp. SCN 70-15]